jgi:hypothetical protein
VGYVSIFPLLKKLNGFKLKFLSANFKQCEIYVFKINLKIILDVILKHKKCNKMV